MALNLASLRPDIDRYEPHRLHNGTQIWTETSCYVDLWIELLYSMGFEPLAALGFTISTDFEGDQWAFLKYPPEDLRAIYGIEIVELNVWRPLLWHISDQLGRGRLLTIEMDSFYLPDTKGVAYHIDHTKTTIVPWSIDPDRRAMRYFHNAGFFSVAGDDFDALFYLGSYADRIGLPPYVELIKLEEACPGSPDINEVLDLTKLQLSRRPTTNPVSRMRHRVEMDLPWLSTQNLDVFHAYAFATCRQCGAGAELAAAHLEWLDQYTQAGLGPAATQFRNLASGAKALQFALARTIRGRTVDVNEQFSSMESSWELAVSELQSHIGL